MDRLISFLKVISDETRLRMLLLLMEQELCVCEICEVLEISQPKVSRHLARMREAGFVRDDRQGQWVFYYANFDDEVQSEIMQAINNKRNYYLQLNQDMNSLTVKATEGIFCSRVINRRGVELK